MKHPAGGQLYRFQINSIPDPGISAEEKQAALCAVVTQLALKPIKTLPGPPQFKSDTFDVQRFPRNPIPIPVAWKLIGRNFLGPGPGHAPPVADRIANVHLSWDDNIGIGDAISGVPDCGPSLTWIAQTYLPLMIPAFDAYRADVAPIELFDLDAADPRGLDGWEHYRWKVFGVSAISFYDDRLCLSAFGVDAATIALRVVGIIPFVKTLRLRDRNGVLMQCVPEFVDVKGLLPIRARVMAAIVEGTGHG